MAHRAFPAPSRMIGFAVPLALLGVPLRHDDWSVDCRATSHIVGRALTLSIEDRGTCPDWVRLDGLSRLAEGLEVETSSWPVVAARLRAGAAREFGILSQLDLYWLGTAWWAYHQPVCHLRCPSWAPETETRPDLALRHPEGGNCESSANGHAALLSYLGVPSRTVYGKLLPSGEGHVWTISDIDGVPLAADVHVVRATDWQREFVGPWRPSPAQVQLPLGYGESLRFTRLHRPDVAALSPNGTE